MNLRLPNMPEPHGPDEAPDEAASTAPDTPEPPTLPGAGFTAAEDAAEESPANPLARHLKSSAVILCVAAVGGGILYGMRFVGMRGLVDAPEVTIDYPFDADPRTVRSDHHEIIADLRTTGAIEQVPVEDLHTNPFLWKGIRTEVAETAPTRVADPAELARQAAQRAAEERRRKIAQAFEGLELRTIMRGATPVASISGRLVRVGDTVDELFTVTAIGGREVELAADGETYTLTMAQ